MPPRAAHVHSQMDLSLQWLYVQICHEEAKQILKASGDLAKESADFFKSRRDSDCAFLEQPEGVMYADIFSSLRLRHIVNDNRNIR